MLNGPPVTLLPKRLAGTINKYSIKAIPQLIRTTPINPVFLRKEISLNLK